MPPLPHSLPRVLEPEVMDTEDEASDYDAMDHSAVNTVFCTDFLATGADVSRVLDLGTGTARIPIELCEMADKAHVVAVDLAAHMLAIAKKNVEAKGLGARIEVVQIDAKRMHFGDATFPAVMSNSIIHHIPEPITALREMWRVLAPGGRLFVRDLARPSSADAVEALVQKYGGAPQDESPQSTRSFQHQRALFAASFHAALTPDELEAMAIEVGMPKGCVRMTSDRHWTLSCKKAG